MMIIAVFSPVCNHTMKTFSSANNTANFTIAKSRTLYVAVVRAVGYRIRNAAIRKRITDDAAVCSTRVIILAGYRAAVRAVIYSRSSTAVSYLCIYL